MNIVVLTLKQMHQRYLTGWLTCFSVALGVALAIAIFLCRREGQAMFGQTDYGYEVLVGPTKGSATQLVLNTVYHIDQSPGTIPYSLYDSLAHDRDYRFYVRKAIPYAVGDSYRGYRIVATSPALFGWTDEGTKGPDDGLDVRANQPYEFADGRCFQAHRFEAVIGSELARDKILSVGDSFQATHGVPGNGQVGELHPEKWTVVGVLKPTHTANDHVIFISLESFYAIGAHGQGMAAIYRTQQGLSGSLQASAQIQQDFQKSYTMNPDGTFTLNVPKAQWLLSAVLVKVRGPVQSLGLMSAINGGKDAMAVNPASVMRQFFSTFLASSSQVLLVISALVTVVACVGILVGIYNSVVYRQQEIAIYRALGATRWRIVAITCLEAGILGLFGSLVGVLLGHAMGAVGSWYLQTYIGQGISWWRVGPEEGAYMLGTTVLAIMAGLLPAWKAYTTPVAENLIAG